MGRPKESSFSFRLPLVAMPGAPSSFLFRFIPFSFGWRPSLFIPSFPFVFLRPVCGAKLRSGRVKRVSIYLLFLVTTSKALVTTSKALVTSSDALVPSSALLLVVRAFTKYRKELV